MRTSKFLIVSEFAAQTAVSGRHLLIGAALGVSLAAFGLAGCHSNPATPSTDTSAAASDPNAPDPAAANLAPVDNSTQVAGVQQQAQPSEQGYAPAPAAAPIVRRQPSSSGNASYSDPNYSQPDNSGYDNQDYNAEQGYNATLSDIEAPQPPPPLPEYTQPVAPEPNYIWTPGYWSYTPQGYYWVPGAWTQPPYIGALWTPGYWGGYNRGYRFHHGFWAAHIGFYGGINYGFGYVGTGYQGGYWNGDNFYYNQYANHVDESRIHNVYQRNVVINNTVINNRVVNNTTYNNVTVNNTRINNVSYNGGNGGIQARPRPAELVVLHEQRTSPMQAQVQIAKAAQTNPQQFYARNQGRPAEVAAPRPLVADRGIQAPPHTTAEINRAAPPQEQLRQHQQAFQPQIQQVARPAATPYPQPNRPAPPTTPGQVQRPMAQSQQRPSAVVQPPNRPAPQQEGRQVPTPANRPVVQPQSRPQQQPTRPQPEARPQQQPHPKPQARPQPEARPQSHPEPQARPQPEARPQPHPQPQARPQPQPRPQEEAKPKPEPHAQMIPRPQPQQRPARNPPIQSVPGHARSLLKREKRKVKPYFSG